MDDRSRLAEWIVDQVADAVIYASRSGVIIRWNRASAALFGFSAEEALGQSLDLIKSGRKLYVEMTFAIVKGETEGEVLGSVAMARGGICR